MSLPLPYLLTDECPDCGAPLTAIVHQIVGTPRATGGLMRVPISTGLAWMQACAHVWDPEEGAEQA